MFSLLFVINRFDNPFMKVYMKLRKEYFSHHNSSSSTSRSRSSSSSSSSIQCISCNRRSRNSKVSCRNRGNKRKAVQVRLTTGQAVK